MKHACLGPPAFLYTTLYTYSPFTKEDDITFVFLKRKYRKYKEAASKTTGINKMSQSLEKQITKEEVNNLIGYVGWRYSTGIQPLTLHESDTGSIHGTCHGLSTDMSDP